MRKHPLAKCYVEGCGIDAKHNGLCSKHYFRLRRHGNVNTVLTKVSPKGSTLEERFWSKVGIKSENECWDWIAGYGRETGYGRFGVGHGIIKDSHVVSYELMYGPVPQGLEISHVCERRICVNPKHLVAETHKENLYRSSIFNGNKTHCPANHEYNESNTIWTRDGRRRCRSCVDERRKILKG